MRICTLAAVRLLQEGSVIMLISHLKHLVAPAITIALLAGCDGGSSAMLPGSPLGPGPHAKRNDLLHARASRRPAVRPTGSRIWAAARTSTSSRRRTPTAISEFTSARLTARLHSTRVWSMDRSESASISTVAPGGSWIRRFASMAKTADRAHRVAAAARAPVCTRRTRPILRSIKCTSMDMRPVLRAVRVPTQPIS